LNNCSQKKKKTNIPTLYFKFALAGDGKEKAEAAAHP